MELEQGLELVNQLVRDRTGSSLSAVEITVLRGAWLGHNYEAIAESTNYSASYLSRTLAPQLWQRLSTAFGEPITKKSFRTCVERLAAQDKPVDPDDQAEPLAAQALAQTPLTSTNSPSLAPISSTQWDWGEAIDVSIFYGRTQELETLTQWIVSDRCRLVALLGMGGIGKTALSVKLAQKIQDEFEFVIWRSLRNAPSLATLLADLVPFLSNQQETKAEIRSLLQCLRASRCLVILDNLETILDGERAGQFRVGYEEYGELLQLVGDTLHQSCLVCTSREKMTAIAVLEGVALPVRTLRLSGSPEVAQAILEGKGLIGTEQHRRDLGDRYSNSPLALKIVATSIRDLFEGKIQSFLTEDTFIFNGIRRLLDQQFQRLSPLEQNAMYWLAVNRDWTTIAELQADLLPAVSRAQLLEALEALDCRSLIEQKFSSYTQQPVVMEYVTDRFTEQVLTELTTHQPSLLVSHALMKTNVRDNIRESQTKLIVATIAKGLLEISISKDAIAQQIQNLLAHLHTHDADHTLPFFFPGYAAGNLLNLGNQLQIDWRGYDFSQLPIRQAYLQGANLSQANFAYASFTQSVFTQTFGSIWTVDFSAQGDRLATGDSNHEVRIWNLGDGQLLLRCQGHTSWIFSVAWSPDNSSIASAGQDTTIRIWNSQTGRCLKVLRGHTHFVWSIAWSPAGEMLASASQDQTIKIWNTQTGECLNTFSGDTKFFKSVAWNPDGTLLASGSEDGVVHLWEVKTGECLTVLQGHSGWVCALRWSRYGQTLVSGGVDQTIRFWNLQTKQCYQVLQGHTGWVCSIAWSPDEKRLASASQDQTLKIWDITTGACLKTLQGHNGWVLAVDWSPQGNILASGSQDQLIKLWDVQTGQSIRTFQGYTNGCFAIAQHPNKPILAAGFQDRTVKLWDCSTGQWIKQLQGHQNLAWSIAWSPNGTILASASQDNTIKLWNSTTGNCLNTLQEHLSVLRCVAWRPDGEMLASASQDNTIKLWNPTTGNCVRTLQEHINWVWSVAWSPDGTILASGSQDETVKLWDAQSGTCLRTLQGHRGTVYVVAVHPNSQILASGGHDQTIKLWEMQTGTCLQTLQGHADLIHSLAWSLCGTMLASGAHDHTIRLWDADSGYCLNTLQGHTGLVHQVIWSADGEILISCSDDGTIKFWNPNAGECLQTLRSDRPYEGMNITGATGLTEAQKTTLKALGAIETL